MGNNTSCAEAAMKATKQQQIGQRQGCSADREWLKHALVHCLRITVPAAGWTPCDHATRSNRCCFTCRQQRDEGRSRVYVTWP